MKPYYEAKRDADDALRESSLAHTIVRPGALTDEPGTGLIAAGLPIEGGGNDVPRDDVAATAGRGARRARHGGAHIRPPERRNAGRGGRRARSPAERCARTNKRPPAVNSGR